MSDVLFRFDLRRWSNGLDQFDDPLPGCRLEVTCSEYPVVKRTPKGAWIEVGFDRRFVLLTAHKQYACETRDLAAESFRARKRRQIKLLKAQLSEAEQALKLIDSPGSDDFDFGVSL